MVHDRNGSLYDALFADVHNTQFLLVLLSKKIGVLSSNNLSTTSQFILIVIGDVGISFEQKIQTSTPGTGCVCTKLVNLIFYHMFRQVVGSVDVVL